MLTAKKARKISQRAGEKDRIDLQVKQHIKGILVCIEKDANNGYCQHLLHLEYYPKNIRILIIHKLEDLGYKVQPQFWFNNLYVISW